MNINLSIHKKGSIKLLAASFKDMLFKCRTMVLYNIDIDNQIYFLVQSHSKPMVFFGRIPPYQAGRLEVWSSSSPTRRRIQSSDPGENKESMNSIQFKSTQINK